MDSKQRPLYCRGVAIGVVREPIEASLVDYPDVFAVSRERIDIVGNTYAEITAKMARVLQSLRYYTVIFHIYGTAYRTTFDQK